MSPTNEILDKFEEKWKLEEIKYNNKIVKKALLITNKENSIEKLSLLKNRTDSSLTNKTSIAFIIKYNNKQYLFLVDAHINVVVKSLKKMGFSKKHKAKFDLIKLSHHGSPYNISKEFLSLIDCDSFLVSGNGSNAEKETFAKILNNEYRDKNREITFIFNYEFFKKLFTEDEKNEYNFECLLKGNEWID